MILLAPGLVQARTAARSWHWVKVDGPAMEQGFFSMVWNLLASFWEADGTGSAQLKNGGQADPSGSTSGGTGPGTTSSTSETGTGGSTGGDNGGQADPSGG